MFFFVIVIFCCCCFLLRTVLFKFTSFFLLSCTHYIELNSIMDLIGLQRTLVLSHFILLLVYSSFSCCIRTYFVQVQVECEEYLKAIIAYSAAHCVPYCSFCCCCGCCWECICIGSNKRWESRVRNEGDLPYQSRTNHSTSKAMLIQIQKSNRTTKKQHSTLLVHYGSMCANVSVCHSFVYFFYSAVRCMYLWFLSVCERVYILMKCVCIIAKWRDFGASRDREVKIV